MRKILIVEDDRELKEGICYALQKAGYQPVSEYTKKEALTTITGSESLLLIDIGLPDGNGLACYKKIRENTEIPAIFLTARDEETDMLTAYATAADDYVVKPFSMKELLARIRAMTRRQTDTTDNVLAFGDIALNRSTYQLTGPENPEGIRLAGKEYQMLEMLMSNPGQVISPDLFMDKIWGYDSEAELNVVWVYISYLRKKLTSIGRHVKIRAARGLGYSLEKDNA